MTEFLNAISRWLSIIALVLAIPLGILANIATPKIQAWLALRSHRALRRRITHLEAMMKQTDRLVSEPTYAIAEFVFMAGLAVLFIGTLIFVEIFAVALLLVSLFLAQPVKMEYVFAFGPVPLLLGFGIGVILAYALTRPFFELLNMNFRVTRYERWKKQTLSEIEELRRKLPQSESQEATSKHAW